MERISLDEPEKLGPLSADVISQFLNGEAYQICPDDGRYPLCFQLRAATEDAHDVFMTLLETVDDMKVAGADPAAIASSDIVRARFTDFVEVLSQVRAAAQEAGVTSFDAKDGEENPHLGFVLRGMRAVLENRLGEDAFNNIVARLAPQLRLETPKA